MILSRAALVILSVLSAPTAGFAKCDGDGVSSSSSSSSDGDGVSSIVAFGDSLSDTGNLNQFPPCGVDDIFCGDRLSNGHLVLDFIAEKLCIDISTGLKPGPESSPIASGTANPNYAFASARAVTDAEDTIADFGEQVSAHLSLHQDTSPGTRPETLHFVWFGGNDIRDALEIVLATQDQDAAAASLFGAVESMRVNIESLIDDAGACSFLVLGSFDVALAPIVSLVVREAVAQVPCQGNVDCINGFVAGARANTKILSKSFNQLLEAMLGDLDIPKDEGCLGYKYFDIISLTEDVLASDDYAEKFDVDIDSDPITDLVCNFRFRDPETGANLDEFGLPSLPEDEIDFECEGFPFYDELHPTTELYELIADTFLDDVEDFVNPE